MDATPLLRRIDSVLDRSEDTINQRDKIAAGWRNGALAIAEAAGLDPAEVSRYRNGVGMARTTVEKVCDRLGIHPLHVYPFEDYYGFDEQTALTLPPDGYSVYTDALRAHRTRKAR